MINVIYDWIEEEEEGGGGGGGGERELVMI